MAATDISQSIALAHWLPEKELRFLASTAASILDSVSHRAPATIEDYVQGVANVFSGKNYGWEEAIADGLWFRYPSEVKGQRFCSEEALKNYLLLKTLGLPASYAIVEDYDGTGLAHELVLVDDAPRQIVVDWATVAPVTKTGNALLMANGEKITFSSLEFLTEAEVFTRVEALRSGESFLSALESGQMLYRKLVDEGEVEAYVRYYPDKQKVEFTFFLYPLTDAKFYFAQSTEMADGKVKLYQEAGMCLDQNGLNYKAIPLFKSTDPLVIFSDYSHLEEEIRQQLFREAVYAVLVKSQDGYVTTQEHRAGMLDKLREAQEDTSIPDETKRDIAFFLHRYERINRQSGRAANTFLDFHMACPESETTDDFAKHYGKLALDSSSAPTYYLFERAKALGRALSLESMLAPHNKLNAVIGQKLGMPVAEIAPKDLLTLLRNPESNTIFLGDASPTYLPDFLSDLKERLQIG